MNLTLFGGGEMRIRIQDLLVFISAVATCCTLEGLAFTDFITRAWLTYIKTLCKTKSGVKL